MYKYLSLQNNTTDLLSTVLARSSAKVSPVIHKEDTHHEPTESDTIMLTLKREPQQTLLLEKGNKKFLLMTELIEQTAFLKNLFLTQ